MRNIYFIFLLSLILIIGISSLGHANAVALKITAQVNSLASINLVSCTVGSTTYTPPNININLGTIIPNYDYIDTPNVAANDPWQIAPPIKITLNIQNNTQTNNLYVYTEHRNSNYWNQTIEDRITPSTSITGLINTAQINAENYYRATAPILAWADVDNVGTITTDPNAHWVWVLDKTMPNTSAQKLLYSYQKILNKNIDIYLRTCWNAPKLGGTYQGQIKLILDAE